MQRNRQVPETVLQDVGGYTQLVVQPTARWEMGIRAERVSGLEDDYLDEEWTQTRARYWGQLTFYPSHFSRVRLQGGVDRPAWLEQPIYSGMLAFEIVVGAHGAHSF